MMNELAPLISDWCLTCNAYVPHDNGSLWSVRGPVSLTRCKGCRTERTWW